ncbi:SigE family RNA polymerase sigma factor [Tessaracoccus antarcticus]|uniref:SigE family RNA polymerase sigma factor n=1 Tax=Tessaracoccus antarcticus TaxID=2479848 RepID=A0A3M0GCL2_9ACTN|nr:SigE family RNA polymerase sigma factor [Tessaracoccus antarcticus]RMB62038.1 SigE family RNA polymerase sigma factor [Tessaracoccus antarcticus]
MEDATDAAAHGIEGFLADRGSGLLRAAWLLTGDDHHAEDLLQSALAKSLGKYDALANDYKFEAYLRTTIYRTFVSWWRRKSWNSETVTQQVPERADDDVPVALRLDVLRALDTLPRMQRAVLSLRYLEDRPIAEVASILGIGEGTVKKYAHRGCVTLQGSVHLTDEEASR